MLRVNQILGICKIVRKNVLGTGDPKFRGIGVNAVTIRGQAACIVIGVNVPGKAGADC